MEGREQRSRAAQHAVSRVRGRGFRRRGDGGCVEADVEGYAQRPRYAVRAWVSGVSGKDDPHLRTAGAKAARGSGDGGAAGEHNGRRVNGTTTKHALFLNKVKRVVLADDYGNNNKQTENNNNNQVDL